MINILLTSKNSFLSKEVCIHLKYCNFFYITREDLLNYHNLNTKIKANEIQYIIHTAWAGVGGGSFQDYEYNLKVHKNLENVSNLVKKIFIFGSGAEFSSTNMARENDLPKLISGSYYALAKNEISHRIRSLNNFVNLRLFGCFGKHENENRFIKKSMNNLNNNKDIIVNKDKEMDFFYVEDLVTLINYYIYNKSLDMPSEVNCVYNEKYKLSKIAEFLIKKYSPERKLQIIESGYADPYTGNSEMLDKLNIKFKGLFSGIEEIYK